MNNVLKQYKIFLILLKRNSSTTFNSVRLNENLWPTYSQQNICIKYNYKID